MAQQHRIKPNTSTGALRGLYTTSDARARKRESEQRRRRLERLARWVSGKRVDVNFQPRGASCRPAPDGARADLLVNVPTDEHDQPATSLAPETWDFVFQKAELIHELGHVLYTDFEALSEHVDRLDDPREQQVFHTIQNIVEDGAIERQLAAEYNVGNDLEIKNANLMVQGEPGEPSPSPHEGHRLDFHAAVHTILLDWAKYDTGRADQLLDPRDTAYVFADPDTRQRTVSHLATLRDLIADVVTEPDARTRVETTWAYYQRLRDAYAAAGQFDGSPGPDTEAPTIYILLPGDPPANAQALDPDDDDIVIELGTVKTGGGGGGRDDDERSLRQRYGASFSDDDDGADAAAELGRWRESVRRTGNEMTVQTDGTADTDNWAAGEQYARRYQKALERALQAERASTRRTGQRAGTPDTQALWKLGYGNTRVFENETQPEEKDYSVVILLDRSASMGGMDRKPWIVDEAEAVTIGLAMALENLGADVAVVSVTNGETTLEKPFAVDTEACKNVLARNESAGGTPLTPALELATDQLDHREGESLVFTVTDGEPSEEDDYADALASVTFPVAGVYFKKHRPDVDDVRQYYHRITAADYETVGQRTEGMLKRLMA